MRDFSKMLSLADLKDSLEGARCLRFDIATNTLEMESIAGEVFTVTPTALNVEVKAGPSGISLKVPLIWNVNNKESHGN